MHSDSVNESKDSKLQSGSVPTRANWRLPMPQLCWLFLWFSTCPCVQGLSQDISITCEIDALHPEKKLVAVKAGIQGLPQGRCSLRLPAELEKAGQAGPQLTQLELQDSKGEALPFEINGDTLTLENNDPEGLELSYQLKFHSLPNTLQLSCLDEVRGLLRTQDVLPSFAETHPAVQLGFQLPSGWQVITPAEKQQPDSYVVAPGKGVFFYLGKATELRATINSLPLVMAIEEGWPVEGEFILKELKRQINYLGKSSREWQAQPSCAVFIAGSPSGKKKQESFRYVDDLLIVTAPPKASDADEMLKLFRYRLAESIIPFFLPFLDDQSAPEFGRSLKEYLTWKVLLKTGGISRDEFLERMAQGFLLSTDPRPGSGSASALVSGRQVSLDSGRSARRLLTNFLTDLSLGFNKRKTTTIFDLLREIYRGIKNPERIEDDWLRKSHTDKGYRTLRQFSQGDTDPEFYPELLKPYALVLVRTEIPRLDFSLSESFRVSRLTARGVENRSGVLIGDRLLAINDIRLVTPEDLIKVRSLIGNNTQVVYTVERNGIALKVKQNLGKEVLLKLQQNKLADADKQERLEIFLAKEVEDQA
jgi:hypothetical protein